MLDVFANGFYWDGILYLAAWMTAINQGFDLYKKIKNERQQIQKTKEKPPKKNRPDKKQKH